MCVLCFVLWTAKCCTLARKWGGNCRKHTHKEKQSHVMLLFWITLRDFCKGLNLTRQSFENRYICGGLNCGK